MILIAVTGVVNRREMLRAGIIVGLACAGVIFLFFYALSQLGLI